MKHPVEDTSLFGIDLIDELVKKHMQADSGSTEFFQITRNSDVIDCFESMFEEPDYDESWKEQSEAGIMPATQLPDSNQVGQTVSRPTSEVSPPKPPTELKPLPNHIKYAYLVLKQHKKAIGWKLSDLPRINPSICMHRILMEEEARPVRQQQRRLNPTILDVVKKEVTKLFAVGIIYPISDSSWVSLVQNDELVLTRVQNSWRVCIDYRKLNQATRKDHFPLPFLDQVLEKLARKSHYYFLDGYSGYMQIHIAPEDQQKTTFTCPFGTFAYTRMLFGLCNAPSTF
ncbi:hypothetical protein CR513_45695, partial [Mucuna pruriens]